jgi:hypothetical protein
MMEPIACFAFGGRIIVGELAGHYLRVLERSAAGEKSLTSAVAIGRQEEKAL